MTNLTSIAINIEKRDGLYFSKNEADVSYPEHGNDFCFQIEDNSFWFQHRNNCIIEAVKNFKPDGLFFDIGGGNGFVAKGLENAGIRCVLVEPGISGAVNARKRGIENVICSTLEDAGFQENSLSAVGLFDVVEHIEDDLTFLTSVHTIVKPGGHVFITVPAYGWLWSDEDKYAGHFRRYTLDSLTKPLEKAGFQMAYQTYIFSILPIPILLFRSIPGRIGYGKDPNDMDNKIQEHSPLKGLAGKVVNKFYKLELKRLQHKRKIPFGGSCLVVGKKL